MLVMVCVQESQLGVLAGSIFIFRRWHMLLGGEEEEMEALWEGHSPLQQGGREGRGSRGEALGGRGCWAVRQALRSVRARGLSVPGHGMCWLT